MTGDVVLAFILMCTHSHNSCSCSESADVLALKEYVYMLTSATLSGPPRSSISSSKVFGGKT